MGYSDNSASVRVDFFKETGKWYTTEAVLMDGDFSGDFHEVFAAALRKHLLNNRVRALGDNIQNPSTNVNDYRLFDMIAVCLEPYHQYSHPIMMPVSRAIQYPLNRINIKKERDK